MEADAITQLGWVVCEHEDVYTQIDSLVGGVGTATSCVNCPWLVRHVFKFDMTWGIDPTVSVRMMTHVERCDGEMVLTLVLADELPPVPLESVTLPCAPGPLPRAPAR